MASPVKRVALTLLTPPLAVCRFGCARCCAAPIAVFWLSGIGAIIYGLLGGPANLTTISWTTVLLGIGLWAVAAIWAFMVIKTIDDPKCQQPRPPLCAAFNQNNTDSSPLDDVKKYY